MPIPTEPIGSIPRPAELLEAIRACGDGTDPRLDPLYDAAVRQTIEQFEETGSPLSTDGEQRKFHNFWTYSVEGLPNTSPDGFRIPFAAGHVRRMPRLRSGPFRYRYYADRYLDQALRYARVPLKQAVISPSALSLMYPEEGIPGYPREVFILARFTSEERALLGVQTCPGGDRDSTHSADVNYADLLPRLFQLNVGSFIPIAQLGTTDDCGFAPFCDDVSTTRETAFAKIRARVQGTALAEQVLGGALVNVDEENEQKLLRSAALKNAESI